MSQRKRIWIFLVSSAMITLIATAFVGAAFAVFEIGNPAWLGQAIRTTPSGMSDLALASVEGEIAQACFQAFEWAAIAAMITAVLWLAYSLFAWKVREPADLRAGRTRWWVAGSACLLFALALAGYQSFDLRLVAMDFVWPLLSLVAAVTSMGTVFWVGLIISVHRHHSVVVPGSVGWLSL